MKYTLKGLNILWAGRGILISKDEMLPIKMNVPYTGLLILEWGLLLRTTSDKCGSFILAQIHC